MWVPAAAGSLWSEARQLAESRERAGWHEAMARGKAELPERLQVRRGTEVAGQVSAATALQHGQLDVVVFGQLISCVCASRNTR